MLHQGLESRLGIKMCCAPPSAMDGVTVEHAADALPKCEVGADGSILRQLVDWGGGVSTARIQRQRTEKRKGWKGSGEKDYVWKGTAG